MPVVTLLVLIAGGKVKAHLAAIVALIVASVIITMPAYMSIGASLLGVVVGFFPNGWIVLRPTSVHGDGAEVGAPRATDMIPARPSLARVSFLCRIFEIGQRSLCELLCFL